MRTRSRRPSSRSPPPHAPESTAGCPGPSAAPTAQTGRRSRCGHTAGPLPRCRPDGPFPPARRYIR